MATEPSRQVRTMSIRLPEETAEVLEAIARAEDMTIADEVRAAIHEHIKRRSSDKALRGRLREQATRYQAVVDRLASS